MQERTVQVGVGLDGASQYRTVPDTAISCRIGRMGKDRTVQDRVISMRHKRRGAGQDESAYDWTV